MDDLLAFFVKYLVAWKEQSRNVDLTNNSFLPKGPLWSRSSKVEDNLQEKVNSGPPV